MIFELKLLGEIYAQKIYKYYKFLIKINKSLTATTVKIYKWISTSTATIVVPVVIIAVVIIAVVVIPIVVITSIPVIITTHKFILLFGKF